VVLLQRLEFDSANLSYLIHVYICVCVCVKHTYIDHLTITIAHKEKGPESRARI
jgi:hypothetical protein